MKTKYVTLLWALKKLGCRGIELKTNWSCSYHPVQRGTFVGGGENGFADGQLYAIEFEPPIHGVGFDLAYWTVEDRNDHRGCNTEATNWRKPQRDFLDKLADIGYELKTTITKRKERKDRKHAEKPASCICS